MSRLTSTGTETMLVQQPRTHPTPQEIREAVQERMQAIRSSSTLSSNAQQTTTSDRSSATHHHYKGNIARGDAKQFCGDIGQVPSNARKHLYDSNIAEDRGMQILGNLDIQTAISLWD
ncbi:hypothetical protein F5B20DRAFT_531256 [Whalleya microplaca]|nr:hypothetical protein F5B20DRAFT_531256 [Whalleya microplaca]